MTKITSLPFQQLNKKAKKAHILPHLHQSLMSLHKMLNKGYTTIFHPENEGVTVHGKENLQSPPAVHRCAKGAKKK
jgi:hypothetical protein